MGQHKIIERFDAQIFKICFDILRRRVAAVARIDKHIGIVGKFDEYGIALSHVEIMDAQLAFALCGVGTGIVALYKLLIIIIHHLFERRHGKITDDCRDKRDQYDRKHDFHADFRFASLFPRHKCFSSLFYFQSGDFRLDFRHFLHCGFIADLVHFL